jgi:heme-degrading monooxygenase HmoA
MITVMNRISVSPEYAETLEERFRNRVGLIDQMPGFLRNQVLRPLREGDPYIILTQWESREHFEAWTQSEAFKQAHARGMPEGATTTKNHVEVHEVIMDTGA